MSASVKKLLQTFDHLTNIEQLELLLEILKRTVDLEFPPLSDEDMIFNAEEIFLELDQQELLHE